MDQEKAYFISDLHLGAQWIADNRAHELAIAEWIRSLAGKASALYILGDAIDYWYEYRTVVPRGFVRFFAAIASLTDAGTPVYWLKGNHDIWIFDYLPREIGKWSLGAVSVCFAAYRGSAPSFLGCVPFRCSGSTCDFS